MDVLRDNGTPGFKYPRRRPWLALIIIAIVAVVVLQRRRAREEGDEEEGPDRREVTLNASAGPMEEFASAEAPEAPMPVELGELLNDADILAKRDDLVGARKRYLAALGHPLESENRPAVESRLAKVNMDLVMTPRAMPEKVEYLVRPGDSLDKIAKRYDTTVRLLQTSNQIKNPNLIKAGDRLKVLQGSFSIVVLKAANELVLYLDGEFFKRYTVGTGKFGKTPVGTFMIADKIIRPPWWRPDGRLVPYGDPENILGTRWMALSATGDTPPMKGYGIHGTWNAASVGKSESAGCIRMRNPEVEELFDLVPMKSPVRIVD